MSSMTMRERLAWGAQLLFVRLRFVLLMIAVAALVASADRIWSGLARLGRPATPPDPVPAGERVEWFCPMDPQVIRDAPDKCPVCGMPLSKRVRGEAAPLASGVLARVELAPRRVALAGVSTVEVARRPLQLAIDTVGTIVVDERRLARISSRVRGRVDQLFVDFTGVEVQAGQPLVLIYSQEVFTSTTELLLARQQGGAALEAPRRRLLLWGLSEEQIAAMLERGQPETHVTIPSPRAGTVLERKVLAGQYVEEGSELYTVADLSAVWMVARVFEDELAFVRLGQPVEIRSEAWPDRSFEGHVSFVEPTVDEATRTVGVRVDVPNAHGLLRPGLFVRATLSTPIGPDGVPAREATSEVVYRCCSACPEIESPAPGTCPKCKMALTPVERPLRGSSVGEWQCACPMHPDRVFRSKTPGSCGLCGAPMVPAAGSAPAAPTPALTTIWECGGHPEATLDRPGICLPCGTMQLVPREVPAGEAPRIEKIWTCPVHPEAVSAIAGDCPFCEPRRPLEERPAQGSHVHDPGPPAAAPKGPLVVPVEAVIDTGERRVAYVEVAPGTWDALEIEVGRRVGDLYPVVRGLRAGQRVVVGGAFLLDAEARLSPGATSGYYGASGQGDGR